MGIISLFLWTIFQGTLSSSNQMNQFHCLQTILSHYNNLYACPWNITGSCSAPNFLCYQNDSLCDLTFYRPTNISIVVFWSSVPILQDKRTVTSNCRCKEVTFSCHIAIEDSIKDLCDDGSMLTTTVTTEGINSATCPQKNGTSVGEIFGAMLGGAALCLLVIAISYLVLRKYRNIKQKQTTKDPIENATQNPAYGSTPNLVAMDNQRGSRSIETSRIYNTISDNTLYQKKVPHDQTKVRYELGTPSMSMNIDLGTYNHLNEVNNKARLPQNDYDHVNNTAANEYTEVVGDGFLNSNTHDVNNQ